MIVVKVQGKHGVVTHKYIDVRQGDVSFWKGKVGKFVPAISSGEVRRYGGNKAKVLSVKVSNNKSNHQPRFNMFSVANNVRKDRPYRFW